MEPQALTIEPFVEGDKWRGIPSIIIKISLDGGPLVAPEFPLASATMRFSKQGSESTPIVELATTVPGEMEIASAAGWDLGIPAQVVAGLTCGDWDWQLRTVDSQGNPLTYLGDTVTILRKI